jgi:uncharacterized protein YfaQ (DUF2300 family)
VSRSNSKITLDQVEVIVWQAVGAMEWLKVNNMLDQHMKISHTENLEKCNDLPSMAVDYLPEPDAVTHTHL